MTTGAVFPVEVLVAMSTEAYDRPSVIFVE
jgi:hypothetical protein